MVHGKHEVIHRKLLSFLFGLVVKASKKSSQFNPFGWKALGMKLELAFRAVNAFKHFEEVKSIQLNSTEFALMCSSHTDWTVGEFGNAL